MSPRENCLPGSMTRPLVRAGRCETTPVRGPTYRPISDNQTVTPTRTEFRRDWGVNPAGRSLTSSKS